MKTATTHFCALLLGAVLGVALSQRFSLVSTTHSLPGDMDWKITTFVKYDRLTGRSWFCTVTGMSSPSNWKPMETTSPTPHSDTKH